MSYVAEELVICTSDLSILGLRTQLCAATESSMGAIRSLFNGLPKALFSPRQGPALAGAADSLAYTPLTEAAPAAAASARRWRPLASRLAPALPTNACPPFACRPQDRHQG